MAGSRTLAFKVLAATLAVAGGAFLLLSFAVYERTFVILDAELGRTLRAHAAALAAGLSPAELALVLDGEGEESAVVRRIRDRLERFRAAAALSDVTVLDGRLQTVVGLRPGSVRGEENPFAALDEPELASARGGQATASTLYVGRGGRYFKSGYAPLRDAAGNVAYLVGVEAEAGFFRSLDELRNTLALLSAGLLFALILLSSLAVRSVTRPLARLADAAERAAGGDYTAEVRPASNDEVGRLASLFNRLLVSVRERQALLEQNAAERRAHLESLAALSAAIAHEVRNPLGSIRGFAELARRNRDRPDKVDDYASEILTEVRAVDVLVGDFLKYARPAGIKPEAVGVAALVERVLLGLADETAKRNVTVGTDIAIDMTVTADPEQLRQILHNLLRNAIEAVPPGGRVEVAAASEADGGARFRVADDGPGIPPDLRARIYEPFCTGKATGTGLGLAIVARSVENHGGRIDVESSPAGTVFTVRLPARS